MTKIILEVQKRDVTGKKVARLRKDGLVPSVVYGASIKPQNLQSETVHTHKVIQEAGKHSPVTLTIDGKPVMAMVKSVEVSPTRHHVRHVAFHAVKQNEVITAEVPIRLVGAGESEAEKAGLVVLQAVEHVEIKAKPGDLPEALELSIVALATTDDKLTLAEIKLPSGVEYADHELDTSLVVANVYEPSALQAANEAAAGDAEASDAEDVTAENGEETPAEKAEA